MKRNRFIEERMVAILRETDRSPVIEVANKYRLSEQAIGEWRERFGELQPANRGAPRNPRTRSTRNPLSSVILNSIRR